jgi:hypothetical protein
MANMAYTFLPGIAAHEGLMLLVHTTRAPFDAEWEPYYRELIQHEPGGLRSLAFTDGGAPNGAQRKQVNDYLRGRSSLAAVVTASSMVRGVVTALSWFNAQMKAFAPDQVDDALRYLGVRPQEMAKVRQEIQLLRKKLGDEALKSIAAE